MSKKDLLPTSPQSGPPLPNFMGVKWPWFVGMAVVNPVTNKLIKSSLGNTFSVYSGVTYPISIIVANGSTQGGTPVPATLGVEVESALDSGPSANAVIIAQNVSQKLYAAGETLTSSFSLAVPAGSAPGTGHIAVKLLDPSGAVINSRDASGNLVPMQATANLNILTAVAPELDGVTWYVGGGPIWPLNYLSYPYNKLIQAMFGVKNNKPTAANLQITIALGPHVSDIASFVAEVSQQSGSIAVPANSTVGGYGISLPRPQLSVGSKDGLLTVTDADTGQQKSYLTPNVVYFLPPFPQGAFTCTMRLKNNSSPGRQWGIYYYQVDTNGEVLNFRGWDAAWTEEGWAQSIVISGTWVGGDPAMTDLRVNSNMQVPPYTPLQIAFNSQSPPPFIPVDGATFEIDWLARTITRVS